MMVIGDLRVSCKRFWSSKFEVNFLEQRGQVRLFHCPHPADVLIANDIK